MTFDPLKEGATEVFDPIKEGAVVAERVPDIIEAGDRAGEVWDISVEQEIPLDSTNENLIDVQNIKQKHQKTRYFRGVYIPVEPIDVRFRPHKTLFEIPKGITRFLERDFAGGLGGTMFDWFGQLIQKGGGALDWWTKLGSKNKSQIYNPYAESIIATGENISKLGKSSRRMWTRYAETGWEKFDKNLKETDPISYGAGRLSEGLASSALAVLATYLSGGTTAAPALLDKGIQINRGLLALSSL